MADDLFGKGPIIYRVLNRVGASRLGEIRRKGYVYQDILLGLAFPVVDPNDAAQQQVLDFNVVFGHGISLDSRSKCPNWERAVRSS